MTRKISWEKHIGRNLKLRDLHVFFTVAQCGSMGRAALELGVAQPTVSEAIADLEHTFGVRLFDRSSQGVEPTNYGAALLKRSIAVFDELKQSSSDIDYLADPTTGTLRIGSVESITATILTLIIQSFSERFPRVVLHVDDSPSRAQELSGLRDRRYDLILLRLQTPLADDPVLKDENVEILIEDELVIACGARSQWARRRKIALADLANEPWVLTAPATWNYDRVAEMFQVSGLSPPNVTLVTTSVHLRTNLPSNGSFITALPRSLMLLGANRDALKVLPVELPVRPWPVAVVTLKNRTLSSVAERFIECAREVAKSLAKPSGRVAH